MNIQALFDLLTKQTGVESFRSELRQQLQEDKKAREREQAKMKKSAKMRKLPEVDGNQEDELLVDFLNQKNEKGNTLLHIAVARGAFEMVEELIGLGVALDTKNKNGESALALAENRMDEDHQGIAALLKTRGNWVKLAKGFNINRVIHMLNEAESEIINASGNPKLLFIGPSGCGKSTFMNARFGVEYKSKLEGGCKPIAQEIPNGVKPVAPVGHGVHSTTLYPYARKLSTNPFTHVDLAGLFDNRGHEHKIVAASTTQWVASMSGGIQGILVFLDLPTLQAMRTDGLRKVADALYNICQGKEELLTSVRYVITKVMSYNFEAGINVEEINELYLTPFLDETRDKQYTSIGFMIKDMVDNLDKIFIDDLSTKSGDRIDNAFKQLKPLPSSTFNFLLHDNAQQNFKDFLIDLPTQYLDIKRRINDIPDELKQCEQIKLKLDESTTRLQQEIAEHREQMRRPFQADVRDASLNALNEQLSRLEADIVAQNREIARLNDQIIAKRNDKAAIDTNIRSLVHTCHEHGFAHRARPEVAVQWTFGAPVIRMEHSYRGWGNLNSQLIYPNPTGRTGVDSYDGANVEYVDDPEGVGRYHRIFRGSEGISEYKVDFHAEQRYLPENRQKIANFNHEIMTFQTNLQYVHRELNRMRIESARLENQISQLISTARENYYGYLEATIADKLKAIENNAKEKQEIEKYAQGLKEEKTSLELELAVNQKLFKTIRRILEDLHIQEINTNEFKTEVDLDLAQSAKHQSGTPSFSTLLRRKQSFFMYEDQSRRGSSFSSSYQSDGDVVMHSTHWYDNNEVQNLLNHFLGQDDQVCLFAALDVEQLNGNTLIDNLYDRLMQQITAQSLGSNPIRHMVLPLNLGNRHWVTLYINMQNKAPMIAYIDPLGSPMPLEVQGAIRKVFGGIDESNILASPIRLQNDGYNCGPWIVECLKYLVTKGGLPPTNLDIDAQRRVHQEILYQYDNINRSTL